MLSVTDDNHPKDHDRHDDDPQSQDNSALAGLVDAAAQGRGQAWAELFCRFNGMLLSAARAHGARGADPHDVAQTTWLRLIENLAGLRDPRALPGWLRTTGTREAIAVARRSNREVPTPQPLLAETAYEHEGLDDQLDRQCQLETLRTAVASLPSRERRLLEALMRPEELSYRQISNLVGIPIGSIGPVRQRAVKRLRATLADSTT